MTKLLPNVAVADFLRGLSNEKTRDTYRNALKHVATSEEVDSSAILLAKLRAVPARQLAAELTAIEHRLQGKPNSVRLRMQALAGLLTVDGLLPTQPPYLMETQPPASSTTEPPTWEQVDEVLDWLSRDISARSARTSAAIVLAAHCGLTTSDLVGLLVEDVDLKNGLLHVWSSTVDRQQREKIMLPIPPRASKFLRRYVATHPAEGQSAFLRKLASTGDNELSVDKGPINTRPLQRDVAVAGAKTGVEGLTVRALRRLFHLSAPGRSATTARQINEHYRKEEAPGHTGIRRSRSMGSQLKRKRKP